MSDKKPFDIDFLGKTFSYLVKEEYINFWRDADKIIRQRMSAIKQANKSASDTDTYLPLLLELTARLQIETHEHKVFREEMSVLLKKMESELKAVK